MHCLRLLIMLAVCIQPLAGLSASASVPESVATIAQGCAGDVFGAIAYSNLPLTAVSGFMVSEFPLTPALSARAVFHGSDDADMPVLYPRGIADDSGRMVARAGGACQRRGGAETGILVSVVSMPYAFPPGGFADALRNYLATLAATALPSEVCAACFPHSYSNPVLSAGFFIAEAKRA